MFARRKLMLVIGVLAIVLAAGAVFATSTSFSGDIASGAQTDTYTLFFDAGTTITAELLCENPYTLDTVLALYNSGGTMIAYNDDGGPRSCGSFRSSLLTYVFTEAGDYTFHVDGFGSSTGPYTLNINANPGAGAPFIPNDDRINPHAFAPVAVYCRAEGTVEIWNIDADGEGTPLLSVAAADQAAGASAGSVSLNTLEDGRLQVNATMLDGKGYVFIFDGCPVTASETYTVDGGNAILFETRAH
jgi:serralysin